MTAGCTASDFTGINRCEQRRVVIVQSTLFGHCRLLSIRIQVVCIFLICQASLLSTSTSHQNVPLSSSSLWNKIYLSETNFTTETANKTVFIKWAAFWCGHSRDLAPAWDQLAATSWGADDQNTMNSQLLIAEVDCAKQSNWCTRMGYTAYPTLTYGDASMNGLFLQVYRNVNKDYETLRDFVQSTLLNASFCTPGNYNKEFGRCSTEEKRRIQKYFNVSLSKLKHSIDYQEGLLRQADQSFARNTSAMQKEYDRNSNQHQSIKANIRRKLKLMTHIHQHLKSQQEQK